MWFLGIDWGEAHHDLCLLDQDGMVLGARRIADGLAGVGELHALVAAHAEDPTQVVVGIETDRGLLVGALLAAGDLVYSVNPQVVSRYRGRHGSQAKSDRGDAKVLGRFGPHRPAQPPPGRWRQPAGRGGQAAGPRTPEFDLGLASGTSTCCAVRCGSSTPAGWPPLAPSWPSRRRWRCWRWRRRRSWAAGSPGQRCGRRGSARVGAATFRQE
jgi:hypothetical protein